MKEHLNTQIEQYLSGEMDNAAKNAFEEKMAQDEKLTSEVNFQRTMFEELGNMKLLKLRNQLHDLGEEFMSKIPEESGKLSPASSKWRKSVMGLMLLALGISSVWFLSQDGDSGSTPEPVQIPDESVPENAAKNPELINSETAESIPEAIPSENVGDDSPVPKAGKSSLETEKKSENQPPEKEPTPRPIAGNFEPNPAWERYFTGTLNRGSDFDTQINSPGQISEINSENGQLTFNFSGSLIPKSDAVPGEFLVRFFSNKAEDFKKNSAFKEIEIEFRKTDGQFHFEMTEDLNFEPGLYYFSLEDWESGEKYFVGKIKVNP